MAFRSGFTLGRVSFAVIGLGLHLRSQLLPVGVQQSHDEPDDVRGVHGLVFFALFLLAGVVLMSDACGLVASIVGMLLFSGRPSSVSPWNVPCDSGNFFCFQGTISTNQNRV